MITIENSKEKIYLFSRENKTPKVEIVKSFRPYFYVEDSNGEFTSIDGKKLKKIICNEPSEVKPKREEYSKHYEADILYTNRYIIDKIDSFENEELRLCYIDIEIQRTESGYNSVEEATNPIIAITCFDSFNKEYTNFTMNKNYLIEEVMLQDFMNHIKETNPDVLIAWNGDGFDFPFIINRIKNLGLDSRDLSRCSKNCYSNKLHNGEYKTNMFGRILFDLMKGYKKISQGQRESWSLDYISKYEKVGEKEVYKGELDDLWRDDIDKFISYNKTDVELMIKLNEKLRIIDFFNEVRKLCFCKFEDVFMNSKIADCMCLKEAHNKFVLPSCEQHELESYEGASVQDTEAKLHKNVAVMDFSSLYPSIMIGFNTSFETILEHKINDCINIDDKYYFRKEIGLIPSIVKPLLDKRKEMKKEMRKYPINSEEYRSLYMTQYALKVIANSFYGALGFRFFRLYKHKVAESITYLARKIISNANDWFIKEGFKIIYSDTDSLFLLMEDKLINEVMNYNNRYNEYLKTYFNQFNINENIFKLEFEKVFSSIFFKDVKKKYAGRIIWRDGKETDNISIVGMDSVRSDYPQVARDFLKEVLKMIIYEKSKEEIDLFIEDFKHKIVNEFTIEQIGLPIGITKDLNLYGNQIHAVAARNANNLHNAQIKRGDKIKYVYVKNDLRVIGFKSNKQMFEGYDIDYDKMIRRLVDLKIKSIYKSLNWQYDVIKESKTPKIKNNVYKNKIRLTQKTLF